jgi:hypothetical protein
MLINIIYISQELNLYLYLMDLQDRQTNYYPDLLEEYVHAVPLYQNEQQHEESHHSA